MMKIALLVADFYNEMADEMLATAKERVKEKNNTVAYVVRVPGCLEMPLMIKALLEKQEVDAVACLGAIIQGETYHDVTIAETLYQKASELAITYGKPVTMGVSGPRQTRAMAEARKRVFAQRAVDAAAKSLDELKKL